MLVWSTILPLKSDNSFEKIYGVCKLWIEGSPHSKIKGVGLLPDEIPSGMKTFQADNEAIETYHIENAFGFRYLLGIDNDTWRTELAFFRTATIIAAYIRIYFDTRGLNYKKPAAKSPYLVKLLVKHCGCEGDGPFPCTPFASQMRYEDAPYLATLIMGRGCTLLPVVYIRPTVEWNSRSYEILEKWIGARAHIVYSPGFAFDRKVSSIANRSPYPLGSITVFVPQAKHPVTIPRYRYTALSRQMAAAALIIRDSTLQATGALGPGFDAIRSACARSEYEKLRAEFASKGKENQEFVTYADKEIRSLELKIKELESRNTYLMNERNRLAARSGDVAAVSFVLKEVVPYYSDELRDAVLHALSLGVQHLYEQGRYMALVKEILANNSKSDFEARLSGAFDRLLRDNRNVQRGDFAEVERMGFVYHACNTHHQIAFKGEQDLMCTIGKTPSDHRSGLNNISQILKRLFQ